MQNITGIVHQGQKVFVFEVQPHIAQQADQLLMEQVEFYQENTGKIHEKFPHIELEIVSLPPEAAGTNELHIHPVGDRKFLCWTGHIEDEKTVHWVFKFWCLGSVYTILTGLKFDDYLFSDEIKGNTEKFEAGLQKEFGLSYRVE